MQQQNTLPGWSVVQSERSISYRAKYIITI